MKNKTRRFPCSDARLLEFAHTVVSFLPGDIGDFTAFDSTFGQSTIDNLQAAIDIAEATKPDDVILDEQVEFTGIVDQKMEACREGFDTVSYFVKKVFKNKKDVQKQFGLKDYRKARNNKTLMIVFMRSLADTITQYRADLIAGGMKENEIDFLLTLHQQLFDARNNQVLYKKQRGMLTGERIEKMNLLYDELKPIGKAARIIYKGDKAMMGRYVLGGGG